jgi:short-subunit dehydrogenase
MKFHNQTVFVTGASRGIGLAIAQAFAREGARVFMTARNKKKLQKEADNIREQGGQAWFHSIDISDEVSVKAAVGHALRQCGQVDVLINNAGVAFQGYFVGHDLGKAYQEMNVNYFGMLRVTHALLPSMIQQQRGVIMNISSLLGIVPFPTEASYSATKAAIISFSQALRGEVSRYGIHVGVVLPGHTDTDMGNSIVMKGAPPQVSAKVTATAVLHAVRKRKKLATIPGIGAKFGVFMCRHFPGMAETLMTNIAKKSLPV